MTSMTSQTVIRQPRPSSLADVLDLILDKGLVIDAYVRVSLVGIELVTIDARIVVASVDTYLRFASATNRLDLKSSDNSEGLPQLMHDMMQGGASDKTKGAMSGAAQQISSWFGGDGDHEDGDRNDDDGDRPRAKARSDRGDRSERRTSSSRESRDRRRDRESRSRNDNGDE